MERGRGGRAAAAAAAAQFFIFLSFLFIWKLDLAEVLVLSDCQKPLEKELDSFSLLRALLVSLLRTDRIRTKEKGKSGKNTSK